MFFQTTMKLSEWFRRIGAMLTLATATLVFADAFSRNFLSAPLLGTAELAANAMVILLFLQVPHILMHRKLLRVTAFIGVMPRAVQHWSEIVAYLLGGLFFVGLVVFSVEPTVSGLQRGEFFGSVMFKIPAWPLRTTTLLLWAVCAACCFVVAAHLYRGTGPDEPDSGTDFLSQG